MTHFLTERQCNYLLSPTFTATQLESSPPIACVLGHVVWGPGRGMLGIAISHLIGVERHHTLMSAHYGENMKEGC